MTQGRDGWPAKGGRPRKTPARAGRVRRGNRCACARNSCPNGVKFSGSTQMMPPGLSPDARPTKAPAAASRSFSKPLREGEKKKRNTKITKSRENLPPGVARAQFVADYHEFWRADAHDASKRGGITHMCGGAPMGRARARPRVFLGTHPPFLDERGCLSRPGERLSGARWRAPSSWWVPCARGTRG